MDLKLYPEFAKWLDGLLSQKLPQSIVAFNFNLYEQDNYFEMELIGADQFAPNDPDWPCSEVFDCGEKLFRIPAKECGEHWEEAFSYAYDLVDMYMDKGAKAQVLKSKKAVGIGFVDGDLVLLYVK